MSDVKVISPEEIKKTDYSFYGVDCVVINKDDEFVLQKRGDNWDRFPGYLSLFGGEIKKGEKPIEALVRELKEELGAKVKEGDVIELGAVTEEITNHSELIRVYFWHDIYGTITGCYEGEAITYNSIDDVLNCPKVMDNVKWALKECDRRGFVWDGEDSDSFLEQE